MGGCVEGWAGGRRGVVFFWGGVTLCIYSLQITPAVSLSEDACVVVRGGGGGGGAAVVVREAQECA